MVAPVTAPLHGHRPQRDQIAPQGDQNDSGRGGVAGRALVGGRRAPSDRPPTPALPPPPRARRPERRRVILAEGDHHSVPQSESPSWKAPRTRSMRRAGTELGTHSITTSTSAVLRVRGSPSAGRRRLARAAPLAVSGACQAPRRRGAPTGAPPAPPRWRLPNSICSPARMSLDHPPAGAARRGSALRPSWDSAYPMPIPAGSYRTGARLVDPRSVAGIRKGNPVLMPATAARATKEAPITLGAS